MEQRQTFWLIGREVRTSNDDPSAIGGLWGSVYGDPFADKLPQKLGPEIYSVYCEYEGDHTQPYTCFLGYRVPEGTDVPEGLVGRRVPAGTYAEFVAEGEKPACIMETWQRIWQADITRAFESDYEVHAPDPAAPVAIYVGVSGS